MWLLRLLAVLTLIVVVGVVLYLLTRNQRYLQFAWRLFRYALIVALLVFALLVFERMAVIPF